MSTNGLLIIFLLVGLVIFIKGIMFYMKLKRLESWIPVDANITRVQIGRVDQPEVNVYIEYFFPEVSYTYFIKGIEYSNNNYSIDKKGWWFHDKSDVEQIVDSMDVSKNIRVFYNPDNHSESVIVKNVSRNRMKHYNGLIGSGAMIIFISIIMFICL